MTRSHQASIYDFIPFLNAKLDWLRRHNTTFDDIETHMQRLLHVAPDGLTPQELVRHIMTRYNMPRDEAEHVYDIAAAMLHRGDLRWGSGRRLVPTKPRPEPQIVALMSVPERLWDEFEKYAYRSRAAWLVGSEERV